jgi:hypothetical protein
VAGVQVGGEVDGQIFHIYNYVKWASRV